MEPTTLGLFAGAAGLGLLHALEPGHGWPVAAAWALNRRARWSAGALAACVIGVGHLISSIAVVLLFFAAQAWLDLVGTRWIEVLAGLLLLGLAGWQLARHGATPPITITPEMHRPAPPASSRSPPSPSRSASPMRRRSRSSGSARAPRIACR